MSYESDVKDLEQGARVFQILHKMLVQPGVFLNENEVERALTSIPSFELLSAIDKHTLVQAISYMSFLSSAITQTNLDAITNELAEALEAESMLLATES